MIARWWRSRINEPLEPEDEHPVFRHEEETDEASLTVLTFREPLPTWRPNPPLAFSWPLNYERKRWTGYSFKPKRPD